MDVVHQEMFWFLMLWKSLGMSFKLYSLPVVTSKSKILKNSKKKHETGLILNNMHHLSYDGKLKH